MFVNYKAAFTHFIGLGAPRKAVAARVMTGAIAPIPKLQMRHDYSEETAPVRILFTTDGDRSSDLNETAAMVEKMISQAFYNYMPPMDVLITTYTSSFPLATGRMMELISMLPSHIQELMMRDGPQEKKPLAQFVFEKTIGYDPLRPVSAETTVKDEAADVVDSENATLRGTLQQLQIAVVPMEPTSQIFAHQEWKINILPNEGYRLHAENRSNLPVFVLITILESDSVVNASRFALPARTGTNFHVCGCEEGRGRVVHLLFGEDHSSSCTAPLIAHIETP